MNFNPKLWNGTWKKHEKRVLEVPKFLNFPHSLWTFRKSDFLFLHGDFGLSRRCGQNHPQPTQAISLSPLPLIGLTKNPSTRSQDLLTVIKQPARQKFHNPTCTYPNHLWLIVVMVAVMVGCEFDRDGEWRERLCLSVWKSALGYNFLQHGSCLYGQYYIIDTYICVNLKTQIIRILGRIFSLTTWRNFFIL